MQQQVTTPPQSTEKCQLNMYVSQGVNDTFRAQAKQAGYGRRPSPFLAHLLKLQTCFLQAFVQRLRQKLAEDPTWFQTREQRFFATELILLLGDIMALPEVTP